MALISGRLCQVLAVITGTLTVISDGMHYGWSSPIVPLLQSPQSPIPISESDVLWLENCLMFGGIAGLFLTMYLLDKVGRKRTMLIAAVENLIAWVLIATATTPEVLLVARFISGIAADVNFVAAPVYIAEIADKEIRGRLSSLINIFSLLGVVLIYSVGPFVSITISSAIGMGFLVTELLTFSSMPESPHYLLVRQKPEAARESLKVLRNVDVDDELRELTEVVERENACRGRPFDLIKVKSYRKAILIMTVLNFGQHFTGLSVMIMNLHIILEEAGSSIKTNTAAIEFSLLMVAACIITMFLIDLLGRRVLLTTSSVLTGISLLVLGVYFAIKNAGGNTRDYTWIPVASLMVYAIVHKIGLGSIPIVVTAELFPTNIKAVGCTVADSIYVIASASSIFVFHYMLRQFGMHAPIFLFAACSILVGLFVIFFLPETKGKTLEQIQQMLKGESDANSETTKLLSPVGETDEDYGAVINTQAGP
ncbi:hypothetical protein PPYR_12064 [Photinus pyralis]|uniref:Major facilitator superfamily (MFS) profile domain-containing protein n=1 Tax=Photinus pyralis TaxID=7054 RepID=A0A1Y1KHM9_PHOPY|nr:facilitated trehalose transporter Tret1-like [Photinus pyralis]KAB0795225.1 hypothetical protein PPYR_12064 [Photinus pyralis]